MRACYVRKPIKKLLHGFISNGEFFELNGLAELSQKMVEKNKHIIYPLVYNLLNWHWFVWWPLLVLKILIVNNECDEKSLKEQNKRSMDEWLFDYLYWERFI